MKNNQEIIEKVTARIIEQLEAGVKPWECAWDRSGGEFSIPRNAKTKEFYHGINIPILWEAAARKGYTTNSWIGYDQAKQLGGRSGPVAGTGDRAGQDGRQDGEGEQGRRSEGAGRAHL